MDLARLKAVAARHPLSQSMASWSVWCACTHFLKSSDVSKARSDASRYSNSGRNVPEVTRCLVVMSFDGWDSQGDVMVMSLCRTRIRTGDHQWRRHGVDRYEGRELLLFVFYALCHTTRDPSQVRCMFFPYYVHSTNHPSFVRLFSIRSSVASAVADACSPACLRARLQISDLLLAAKPRPD